MRDIEIVIAIAECKSISKAAEILYISQPSLSRSIHRLEKEVGMKLFFRRNDGVELTEAGEIYVEYGKKIKALHSTMHQKLKALHREKTQNIHVGMTLNTSYMSVVTMQEKLKKRYPDCELSISNIRSVDIVNLLESTQCHFIVGPEVGIQDDRLAREQILNEYLLLMVPERWNFEQIAEKRENLPYAWLDLEKIPSDVDFILQESSSAVRKDLDQVLEEYDLRIVPKMTTVNSVMAIQAAERQLGCCFISEAFFAYIADRGKVRLYCVGKDIKRTKTCLMYLKDRMLTEQEKYCKSVIREQVTQDYYDVVGY